MLSTLFQRYAILSAAVAICSLPATPSAQTILAQWNFNDGTEQGWSLNVQENGATNPNGAAHRFVVAPTYASCQAFFPGYGNATEAPSPNQPNNACTSFVGEEPGSYNLRVTTLRGIQSNPPCLLPAVCAVDLNACGGLNNCCSGTLENEILFAKSPVFSTAGFSGVTLEFSWHMKGGLWPAANNPALVPAAIPEARIMGEIYYSYDGTNWSFLQSANIGGGGGNLGQLRDQPNWFRARVTSPLLDNRPSLYLGFRHVIVGLYAPWSMFGIITGNMNYSVFNAISAGQQVAEPGLAIDDILVYVPAPTQQLTVLCPDVSPNSLNANAGQNFFFPVNLSGQVGAADVTIVYGDGAPNTVLDNHTDFPFVFSHTYAAAGTYNYTVTVCQNGQQVQCTGTINVVNCPNDIVLTPTFYSGVTSCGFANGSVLYDVQPPGAYTFSISPSGPTVLPNGFQDVPAGQYLVTVTDNATGCTGTDIVDFPAPLSVESVSLQNTTCGLPNGQATITLAAGCGNPPFTFYLENIAGDVLQQSPATNNFTYTFTNLAAGQYAVRATDASGASAVWSLNPFNIINQGGSGPTFSITTLDPTGCNTNDGIILIEPTGGSQPYTITIEGVNNNYQTSQTSSSLQVDDVPAGTYNITVVDAAGCPGQTGDPLPVVLVNQSGPMLNVTETNVSSCVANNGAIRITIGNGTATSYSLNGGQNFTAAPGGNPFDVTGLASGNYNVVVVAAECTLTYANNPVFIAGPPTFDFYFGGDPSFTANYAEPCGGTTDQDIWINGNIINPGGYSVFYEPVPPGSYLENDAGSVLIIHELVADTYLVRLTHIASGCTFERTLIVESPVGIDQATTNAVAATCNANNGAINVFLVTTCGEPPFTYRLLNEAGTTTVAGPVTTPNFNHTFNNLAPGTYTIRVRDGGADTDETTIVVPAGDTPEPQATPVAQPTGCTTQDGAFDATLAGAVPEPVTVEILLAGAVVQTQTGTSAQTYSFTGLTQGLYTVRATDATGCSGTTTIQLLSNLSFSFGATVTPPTCTVPTSEVAFDLSAGTAPAGDLTVVVNGETSVETGFPFTRTLAPGTYTVQITGAGCDAANGPIQIVVPEVPTITILDVTVNAITQCGGTGGFSVEIQGATYPVNYVVSNQTGQVLNGTDDNADNDNVIVFETLGPGTYTLLLADAAGCGGNLTNPVVLNEPLGPEATVELLAPCPPLGSNPAQGGEIVVTVTGGQPPYFYTVLEAGAVIATSPGAVASNEYTFNNLTEGTYRVEVRDAAQCVSVRDALNLTAPPPLDFNVTGTGVPCPGGRGSLRFSSLTGGTPPYEVSYNGVDFQLFGSLNNGVWPDLNPGTYTARLRDSRGCLSSPISVEITPPLPVLDTLSTVVVHPLCVKGPAAVATGAITVNFKDGTPPYRIFTTAENDTIDLGNTPSFTRQGVAPGNYAVYIFDACTLRTFVLRVNPGFEVDVDATAERCIDEAGTLELSRFVRTPAGGRWEDRTTPSNIINGVFSAPAPGNYQLFYVAAPNTDNPQATCEDTLRLTIHPRVEAGEPIFVCEGSERINVSATPPGGTWSSMDPGAASLLAGLNNNGSSSVSGVRAGTYFLTYNRFGCEDDLILTVHPTPKTRIVVNPNPERLPMNEDIVFTADTAGSNYRAPYRFYWEFMHDANLEPGVIAPVDSGEVVKYQYKESGDYTVRLITTNDLGCADTVEQKVTVGVALDITFPNIITPNGDGVNDRFEVNIPLPGKYKMRIFDRHGVLMARLPEDGNAWVPKDNVPDGTYFFSIEAEDPKLNRKIFRTGQFTIIR